MQLTLQGIFFFFPLILKKIHSFYRALYEIDPYLDVQIFNDVDSLDQFLGNDSFKLTLLFDQISPSDPEELQTIKHAIRRMARERNIPVISFRW